MSAPFRGWLDRVDPQIRIELAAMHTRIVDILGVTGVDALGIADLKPSDLVGRRKLYESLLGGRPISPEVSRKDLLIRGPQGPDSLFIRVYRPINSQGNLPIVYYVHGGGMILGSVSTDDLPASALAESIGVLVVSVEYRLAPEHPYPAAIEDCFAGLAWLAKNAGELGGDPTRIALYGESAGGGLAAATALMARDKGGPPICLQMLIYPMLDDRNETASSREPLDGGVWDRRQNQVAWSWYLGERDEIPYYAAPARAEDLMGLPPAYIDVGEVDLFRDEDIDYATKLMRAGTPTELHVYPGGIHGCENLAPTALLSQRVVRYRHEALRRALLAT